MTRIRGKSRWLLMIGGVAVAATAVACQSSPDRVPAGTGGVSPVVRMPRRRARRLVTRSATGRRPRRPRRSRRAATPPTWPWRSASPTPVRAARVSTSHWSTGRRTPARSTATAVSSCSTRLGPPCLPGRCAAGRHRSQSCFGRGSRLLGARLGLQPGGAALLRIGLPARHPAGREEIQPRRVLPHRVRERPDPAGRLPDRARLIGSRSGADWSRDTTGVVLAQGPAPVDQYPQHRQLDVIIDWPQAAHGGADQGDGVRVGGVGLAALPGGEHTGARADSFGGTSTTCSPSPTSRLAT